MYEEVIKFSLNVPSHASKFTSSNNNSLASNRQSILAYKQSEQEKERLLVDREVTIMDWVFLFSLLKQNNSQIEFPKTINLLSLLINV